MGTVTRVWVESAKSADVDKLGGLHGFLSFSWSGSGRYREFQTRSRPGHGPGGTPVYSTGDSIKFGPNGSMEYFVSFNSHGKDFGVQWNAKHHARF